MTSSLELSAEEADVRLPDPCWILAFLSIVSFLPTPVAAEPGDPAANGIITGRVTDDGAPVEGAYVRFVDNVAVYEAPTGADGRYSISLPPSAYWIYADPPYGSTLSPQLYDRISCLAGRTCELPDGDPVTLAPGGQAVADFPLADLGAIEGRVWSRETLEPVTTGVHLYDAVGEPVAATGAVGGVYRFTGLAAGRYYLVADGVGELAGLLYPDAPCRVRPHPADTFDCARELGQPVEVAFDATTSGIDLALHRGATISGRVVAAATGLPFEVAQVVLRNADFEQIGERIRIEDEDGGNFEFRGLANGRYYLHASSNPATPQFFRQHPCPDEEYCLAGALPIDVEIGRWYGNRDFALVGPGTLTGRVVDETSGAGIEGAVVSLYPLGAPVSYDWARTDSAGFFSFSGVPAMGYAVGTEHEDYRAEYYDDVDAALGPAGGKLVFVEPNQVGAALDIRLARRATITGRVYDADSGNSLSSCFVQALAANAGGEGTGGFCEDDGTFEIRRVLPGSYHLVVGAGGYAPYQYGRGSCNRTGYGFPGEPPCHDLEEGPVVEVRSGQSLVLQFPIERVATLESRTTFDEPEPPPTLGAVLRVYESDGDQLHSQGVWPTSGLRSFDLAPGKYRVMVEGSPYWQSFPWQGELCNRWYCDPWAGEEIELEPGEMRSGVDFHLRPIDGYAGCTPSETTLCLNQGRFEVKATWIDFGGLSGAGTAKPLTADTGYFYFFSPTNLEVVIKALNGCQRSLGHHFWIYAAGLTDVQVELAVRDTLTGEFQLYSNLLGNLFRPILDSGAFGTCDAPELARGDEPGAQAGGLAPPSPRVEPVEAPAPLEPAYCESFPLPSHAQCLAGRFAVSAVYRTRDGLTGDAYSGPITADTGYFYFFDRDNLEVVVKVLDACATGIPGYWVFASGLTDVAVELTIVDLATGQTRVYDRGFGPFAPILDFDTFPCD